VLIDEALSGGVTPDGIRLHLEEHNIESRPLWKPMHMQPVYQNATAYVNGVSEELFRNGLCLPSGSSLTYEEQLLVCELIKQCWNAK
jgi:dTDP-4-amino-4,6-dideoxygalactose transaminase